MELEVIRHKTSELFFKGFFPEDVASSYSYQLQRMFESGAAREGDYFVVTRDGKPYLNIEIYRNNTRRIWEKPPSFALGVVPGNKSELISALKPVFNFLDDQVYYFKPDDKLEIVISDDWKESDIINEIVTSHGYSKFGELEEYSLTIPKSINFSDEKNIFHPFSDLEPEERFSLVYEYDATVDLFEHITPDKLYQDYIEEGYESEPLWKFFTEEERKAGFIMPVFTSGMKTELKLLNYHPGSFGKGFASDTVSELIRIAKGNDVRKITFSVKTQDDKFKSVLKDIGAVKTNTFERYAKK